MQKEQRRTTGYGIGEWYGRLFTEISDQERKSIASKAGDKSPFSCPFRSTPTEVRDCNKKGGVCTIRKYVRNSTSDAVSPAEGVEGALCTVCPNRFHEDRLIYHWIGSVVLGDKDPVIVDEIGFLESTLEDKSTDVGRIDNILVSSDSIETTLNWCALEKQSVYFQGGSMNKDFAAILEYRGEGIPFPVARRQPDYRSSGPKRLMPQLQIKVPSLRRWGKKMAVVVDQAFFRNLGAMETVEELSNADIAWFVVRYDTSGSVAKLLPGEVQFTTLERAVEGLTAGKPVSQSVFEQRIREKLPSYNE